MSPFTKRNLAAARLLAARGFQASLLLALPMLVAAQHAVVDDEEQEEPVKKPTAKLDVVSVDPTTGERSDGSNGEVSSGRWWYLIIVSYAPLVVMMSGYYLVRYFGNKNNVELAKVLVHNFCLCEKMLLNFPKPFYSRTQITQLDVNLYRQKFIAAKDASDLDPDTFPEKMRKILIDNRQKYVQTADHFKQIDIVAILQRRHDIYYYLFLTHWLNPEQDVMRIEFEFDQKALDPFCVVVASKKNPITHYRDAHKDLKYAAKLKKNAFENLDKAKADNEITLNDKYWVFADLDQPLDALIKTGTATKDVLQAVKDLLMSRGGKFLEKVHVSPRYMGREYYNSWYETPEPKVCVSFDFEVNKAEQEECIAMFNELVPAMMKVCYAMLAVKLSDKNKRMQLDNYNEQIPVRGGATSSSIKSVGGDEDPSAEDGGNAAGGTELTSYGKSKQKQWEEAARLRKEDKEK